jgi:hypothetical protein
MGPKNVRFARHCPRNRKVAGPNPARSTTNLERVLFLPLEIQAIVRFKFGCPHQLT